MDCFHARRMLEAGIVPSSLDTRRALLGFHVAGCPSCQAYHQHAEKQRVLTLLLAQPTPSLALALREPLPTSRNHRLPLRQSAGAALLIATAIALVPLGQAVSAHATVLPPVAQQAPVRAATQPVAIVAVPVNRPQAQSVRSQPESLEDDLLPVMHARTLPARPQSAAVDAANAVTDWALFAPNQGVDVARSQLTAFVQAGPQVLPPQVLDFVVDPSIADLRLQAGQMLIIPADPPVPEPPPPVVIAPDVAAPAQGAPRRTATPQPRPAVMPAPRSATKPQVASRPTVQTSIAYQIQPGDTLSSIALRFYDAATRWPELYRANRTVVGSNPDLIFPNQRLVIPGVRPGGTVQNPASAGTGYTVRSGDTLSDLALRFYGNGNLWPLIYSANCGVGNNPDLIFPQQQLTIPSNRQAAPQPPQPVPRPPAQPVPQPTAQPVQPPNNQLPPPLPAAGQRYTVLRGDSLRSIAQRAYNNETRWRDIYQANRANIPDPDALQIGVGLELPK